ncbi:hypothetical protein AMTRI_Chr06g169920 [Amborella trichopoda]
MQFHINIPMMQALKCWLLTVFLFSINLHVSEPLHTKLDNLKLKTSVFLSPKFIMKPGTVQNNFYYNIDFPTGHIAIKGFDAEIVDEEGNPVPLYETYIHHLAIVRYYAPPSSDQKSKDGPNSKFVVRNAGVCQDDILNQYFGLGPESRKTRTTLPDPYGVEVGVPPEGTPDGYEEGWMLNIHAIDMRGVEDRSRCGECRCDLYNVTEDENGRSIEDNYYGGLRCCYDGTQCRLKEGLQGLGAKGVYLKYTVKWMEWDDSIIPLKIYILDVTDSGERILNSTSPQGQLGCQVEYNVDSNGAPDAHGKKIHIQRTRIMIPHGGDVIYGMAHQHPNAMGCTLYGQDGRVICTSSPTYGQGKEAGNEAGYVVGMGTCYPRPGSVKVKDGETLILESRYSATTMHTGVMGLFHIFVAESKDNVHSPLLM